MRERPAEEERPGHERRRKRRQQREQQEALAWWRQPGVLIFLLALGLATAGWFLLVKDTRRIPVREAEVGGLQLKLEEARWVLDQMDHGENFQRPSTMMPDMPEWGSQRVTIALAFENISQEPQLFAGEEFYLVPELGKEVPPVGAQVGRARLEPDQRLNTALHFDFDTTQPHGKLLVEWRRQGESVYLPIPEPAEHYHLRPRGGEVSLPQDARLLLPIGNGERGRDLFLGRLGCAACHGDPAVPDSNNVGPHLAGMGTTAATRVDGLPAPQYIYDSIREPGLFIAPDCKNGPCTEPTAMPEYASLMDLQQFADVVTYLLNQ